MKTIAIIGGGFSGTLTAVNLVRLSRETADGQTLRVVLINSGAPTGKGVAYGTSRPEHLLNVVAGKMTAFPDQPSHFVEWLRGREEWSDADPSAEFVSRRLYGEYLSELLAQYSAPAASPSVALETVEAEAVDLLPTEDGLLRVVLENGTTVSADRVVLATGNLPPRDILPEGTAAHPALRVNPWQEWWRELPESGSDVLLVGTGLTMIDAFLTLTTLGWRGTVHAVSPSGKLPLSHPAGAVAPYSFPEPEPWTLGLTALAALMEGECRKREAAGEATTAVVDSLRPVTQRVWQSLSVEEKQEFLRTYRARWNGIRHRIPPQVAAGLAAAQQEGRLRIQRGRVGAVENAGEQIRVTLTTPEGPSEPLRVALLVNCTGPLEGLEEVSTPFFRSLFERGLVRSDALGIGLDASPAFAVVGQDGEPSRCLFALGPLLKGLLWETTAVPELRVQAYDLARTLLEG